MKKRYIVIIVIAALAILGLLFPTDDSSSPEAPAESSEESEVDLESIIAEHFADTNLIKVDHITAGKNIEVALELDTSDKDAADAGISLHSDSLAKKLNAYDVDSLSLIWALPSLSNVCQVDYERQGSELVQTKYEYDI